MKDSTGRPGYLCAKGGSPTRTATSVSSCGSDELDCRPRTNLQTKLFYVTAPSVAKCSQRRPQPTSGNHAYYGSAYFPNDGCGAIFGRACARSRWIPILEKLTWEWKLSPTWSECLQAGGSEGGVTGRRGVGNFIALGDAASGKALWHFSAARRFVIPQR